MTRSRLRKIRRVTAAQRARAVLQGMPLAAAILACLPTAYAQEKEAAATAATSGGLEEITVTATKRTESLQDVPLSIQALGTAKLEALNIQSFDDYVKYLPSVTYQTFGPGFAKIYMRGVSSGGTPNHSGSLPSVGVYLDEQPITTIQGPLDIHTYDIARVETLPGPQGTLYGASSQAGTIRIITNKPDVSAFSAAYDVQANSVDHGDFGGTAEGYVNIPIGSFAAVRLVAWDEHDAGYINNVHGTLTYPLPSGFTLDNSARVKKHYNDADIQGARAALKIDLNDNWTLTPTIQGQQERNGGQFAFNPKNGDLNVAHFYPESARDAWYQAALTLEGNVSNFDIVYSYGLIKRHDETQSDYTDYTLGYNSYYAYYADAAGKPLANASQRIEGRDHYTMQSQELRVSSPKDFPLRATAGLFMARQQHQIEQRYVIDGLGPQFSVDDWAQTWWLTEEKRINRDYAMFTELSYDLTSKLTATAGIRRFEARNSLEGFYGFGLTNFSSTGENSCFARPGINGGPCENVDKLVDEKGSTPKFNLSYKFTSTLLVYATYSRGFRPGGINRVGDLPPYKADYLGNYELGWKTQWFENRLRFNGAVFRENWKDFQFSFLGPNSVTEIANAGQAKITGLETEIDFAATRALTLSGGFSLTDAKLAQDYCGVLGETSCPEPLAPAGQMLPTTPKFKGNATARYAFGVKEFNAYAQAAYVYQSQSWEDLRTIERNILGPQRAYGVLDIAVGAERHGTSFELFINNVADKRADIYNYAECTEAVCGPIAVYELTNIPRTIGIKFGQKF
jgi:outer membrane receptor protein involved in Fe transport